MMHANAPRAVVVLAMTAIALIWSLPLTVHAGTISLVGTLKPLPSRSYGDVWAEGDYAYIGGAAGIAIIDISDPSSPFLAAVYDPPGDSFFDVKVHGGIGYFPNEQGSGLHIVNLSDPTMPSLISRITSAQNGYDNIHNVYYANGYIYEAGSFSPVIKVFDVRDPNSPIFVRDIVTPGNDDIIHDITVINDRLYASGRRGIGRTYIYEITNIGSVTPALLGTVITGNETHSSWVPQTATS